MKLTPLDIRHKEFKRGMRGYVDGEVDEFLDEVADEFERLFKENIELTERGEALQEKIDQYRNLEETLQNTLVAAQRSAEELKANAQKEAQLMLSEAELKARQMVNQSYGDKQAVEKQIVVLKASEAGLPLQVPLAARGLHQAAHRVRRRHAQRPPSSPARPSRSKTPWQATRPVTQAPPRRARGPPDAGAAARRSRPPASAARRSACRGPPVGADSRSPRPPAAPPHATTRRARRAATPTASRPRARRPNAEARAASRPSATPTRPPVGSRQPHRRAAPRSPPRRPRQAATERFRASDSHVQGTPW